MTNLQDSFDVAACDEQRLSQVLALTDGVSRTVRIARALVEAERAVSVDGIDNAVGSLCARALDLPPELGRRAAGRLCALRSDIDALTAALAARAPAD